jgi:hypothetical protein
VLLLFALVGWLAGVAQPASSVILVTHCPHAPSGWKAPASTPQWPASQWPNGVVANVNCAYVNAASGKQIMVTAEYATRADVNPVANFFFGCGVTGSVQWSAAGRRYQLTSSDRWLYASFSDPARVLTMNGVGLFEQVTRALLLRSEPFAHRCLVR